MNPFDFSSSCRVSQFLSPPQEQRGKGRGGPNFPRPPLSAVLLPLFLAFGLLRGTSCFAAIDTNNEQQLIMVLRSNASLTDKDAACARLKRIGTAKSVPALAALLPDQQLSHSARYALESIDLAAAGRALIDALNHTSGLTKAGIINSLGVRGEVPAVPAITRALRDTNTVVATTAAWALGQIGAPPAFKTLLAALKKSTGPLHQAEVDALLRWGQRLQANDSLPSARQLYRQLYDSENADGVRVAAYRGLIQSSPNDRIDLIVRAIPGPPGPSQVAALQAIHDLPGREGTFELCQLLPHLEPALQIPLIGGLCQHDDPAAVPAVAALASSRDPEVRLAALRALDTLGDASSVPVLAEFAATGSPAEQLAARQALVDLRRGPVTDALLQQLGESRPAVQAQLTLALGQRGDQSAVPKLFDLAQQKTEPARKAAFQALGELADNDDLAGLARFVDVTKEDTVRTEAAQALRTACQHIQARRGSVNLEPLLRAIAAGSPDARIALMPVCSGLIAPELRLGIRTGLQDPDPRVRDAAIRALCDTIDGELLQDIVTLARSEPRDNFRVLAITGGVRLATQEETVKISNGQRISALNGLLAACTRPEDKKLVLSGLADVPDLESLHVVEGMLDQPGVQAEASRAAIKISLALPSGQAHDAMAVLDKALAANTNDSTKQAIQAALKQIQASADYLTDWQVAGPYRQTGKNYSALFDILFPPELENAKGVTWQPLPAATDPQHPWEMDLLKALGGQECVAYARTWVHCDQDLKGRLELGSDDGIKVWLNDKQVYAKNVSRALQPGSDVVEVSLHSGWNRLLFKVTQHNQGWAFCARLLKSDGSPVEGLRCEATPST